MNRLPAIRDLDRKEIAKSALALGSFVLNGMYVYKLFSERQEKRKK